MMPELDVERVPIFRKVRLAPVRAIVIDLQRGVRVFTEPAPPLTEKISATSQRSGRLSREGTHHLHLIAANVHSNLCHEHHHH